MFNDPKTPDGEQLFGKIVVVLYLLVSVMLLGNLLIAILTYR